MSNDLLKELEIEGIAELIAERFDDAVDLMHPSAIVYGGAIRDILAGMPLEGDLDIATDGYSYRDTSRNFRRSPKWTEEGRCWVPSMATTRRTSPSQRAPTFRNKQAPKRNSYEDTSMPVADTTSFVTYNSAKAQIVMAKSQSDDSHDAALEIVKHVDFVCCGLAMDNTGRVFEVIEGAYEDCKNRVLRLNKTTKNISIDSLKERVAKLKSRGWESKINISAVKKRMEKAHKAKVAEQKKQMKARQKSTKDLPSGSMIQTCAYIAMKESKTGPFRNYSVVFNRRKYEDIFSGGKRVVGLTRILHAISTIASDVGININHKPSSNGCIEISIATKKVASKVVHHYAIELEKALENLAIEGSVGKHYKKSVKKKVKKSAYHAFAENSRFSDSELSAKLRGKPILHHHDGAVEEMPIAQRDELVEPAYDAGPAAHAGVETMSFKAGMAPDGQIMINPIEGGNPDSPDGDITIDVSDLPPDAAQQLRVALENAEPEDVVAPSEAEEVPAHQYFEFNQPEPDSEIQEMGQATGEDSYPDLTSIGEDPDERHER